MTDSTILALDLAFMIPETLRASLTAFNRTLRPPPDGFYFDATHLPHLTLVQQFVLRSELVQVGLEISQALHGQPALNLITTEVTRHGESSTLGVTLTQELKTLHQRLLDVLLPFNAIDGGPDAFWGDGIPPRETDLEWITTFREKSAGISFDPHVTLGVGAVKVPPVQSPFVASEIALCHLGRFCTCRCVLKAWTLIAQDDESRSFKAQTGEDPL